MEQRGGPPGDDGSGDLESSERDSTDRHRQLRLMRNYGEKPHLVQGCRGNVKLTTDLDLLQYELLAASGHLAAVIGED